MLGSSKFQAACHPLPACGGCSPANSVGGPAYWLAKLRKRPTVTSYLSSMKSETVVVEPAGNGQLVQPGTSSLVQQLSLPALPHMSSLLHDGAFELPAPLLVPLPPLPAALAPAPPACADELVPASESAPAVPPAPPTLWPPAPPLLWPPAPPLEDIPAEPPLEGASPGVGKSSKPQPTLASAAQLSSSHGHP